MFDFFKKSDGDGDGPSSCKRGASIDMEHIEMPDRDNPTLSEVRKACDMLGASFLSSMLFLVSFKKHIAFFSNKSEEDVALAIMQLDLFLHQFAVFSKAMDAASEEKADGAEERSFSGRKYDA